MLYIPIAPWTVPYKILPECCVEESPRFSMTRDPWRNTLIISPTWICPTSVICWRSSSVDAALEICKIQKQIREIDLFDFTSFFWKSKKNWGNFFLKLLDFSVDYMKFLNRNIILATSSFSMTNFHGLFKYLLWKSAII